MRFESRQLQFAEVVAALSQRDLCTLVHLESQHEVSIWKEPGQEPVQWRVRYLEQSGELPNGSLLSQALAAGFHLRELAPGCRPPQYELYQVFGATKAAAAKGLELARLLPGVPASAWLWVTVQDHDSRGEPPTPPDPWPPTST